MVTFTFKNTGFIVYLRRPAGQVPLEMSEMSVRPARSPLLHFSYAGDGIKARDISHATGALIWSKRRRILQQYRRVTATTLPSIMDEERFLIMAI